MLYSGKLGCYPSFLTDFGMRLCECECIQVTIMGRIKVDKRNFLIVFNRAQKKPSCFTSKCFANDSDQI